MRLVFKNEKLEALAKEHLKSDVVMVLDKITVNELIEKMLQAMQAPRQIRHRHIQLDFYGKSVRFPIRFEGGDLMEKVFKRICTIEESRELSKNSSNEDLHNKSKMSAAVAAASVPQTPSAAASASLTAEPMAAARPTKMLLTPTAATTNTAQAGSSAQREGLIIAEFSMRELSDGGPKAKKPRDESSSKDSSDRKKHREHKHRRRHHRDSGKAKQPRSHSSSVENSDSGSLCNIF